MYTLSASGIAKTATSAQHAHQRLHDCVQHRVQHDGMITASTQQTSVPNLLVMSLASGKLTHALAKQQSCIGNPAVIRIGKAAVM